MLSDSHKLALLRLARESIADHLAGCAHRQRDGEALPEASGVFVTIKHRGELRGCIGVLQMHGTLAEEVARCACDSATRDPRFRPMSAQELPDVALEISVLGPFEQIDLSEETAIRVGEHGLMVSRGHRRGLLLPQVPVEWGWTRDQFLTQTCRKAGLPDDAWRDGASVFRFEAEVFGE